MKEARPWAVEGSWPSWLDDGGVAIPGRVLEVLVISVMVADGVGKEGRLSENTER
jgi:hypothetical protein